MTASSFRFSGRRSLYYYFIVSLFFLTTHLSSSFPAYGAEKVLTWHASPSVDTVGYKVYKGNISRNYTETSNAGAQLSYNLTSLSPGATYFFAVTAYYANGAESDYSEEVSVSIPQANSPPVAIPVTISTSENTSVTGTLPASDTDSNAITFSIVNSPSTGQIALLNSNTGSFSYTPSPGFIGTDTFTFKVNDGVADSNAAVVTVLVSSVNHVPVAAGDQIQTLEDTPVLINVLLNDSDADGDSLQIASFTQGSNGSVSMGTNLLSYSPGANFNGTDRFVYTISDGRGGSASAEVIVSVLPVNDAPIVSSLNIMTMENTAVTGSLSALDPDNDHMVFSIISQPTNGVVTITDSRSGSFRYTPNNGAIGSDSFTFKVNDGLLDSNTGAVSITIRKPSNEPPTAGMIFLQLRKMPRFPLTSFQTTPIPMEAHWPSFLCPIPLTAKQA